jgi:cytochrome c oxidase subunit 1
VVVTGTLVALMGGLYHWFPKMFGRHMNNTLGRIHFWGTVIAMNGIFFPMFIQGLAGVQRRMYDFSAQAHNVGTTLGPAIGKTSLSELQWICALALLVFQLPFLFNIFWSLFKGEKSVENPWESTTLEWDCPSPPPHGNFTHELNVVRGPYEYSVPGAARDWLPQSEGAR